MKKRLLKIAVVGVVVIVVLAAGVFYSVGRKGSGTVEGWIGSQVQAIAGSYLKPKLSFSDLDYEYPLTVTLKDLRLIAADPSNPGKTIDVIACGLAGVTLGEIPSVGKPIVIEKIVLESPLISAVAYREGSKDFVGFSDLLRDPATDEKPAEEPAAPLKLSDAFRMRLVQLKDGKIVYDPRIPGTVPMTLDEINTSLSIEPTTGGQYKLSTVIARKPVFEVEVAGQVDLDSFTAQDIAIKLSADLGADKLDYLPPELQKLLKQYDARGKLSVAIDGTMPIMDPMKGDVTANVTVDKANMAFGDFRAPVEQLSLSARFDQGKVTLPSLKVSALDGTAEISGSATLNERLDANLQLTVAGMMLERALAAGPSPTAPRLDLKLNVAGSLMTLLGKLPVEPGVPVASVGLKDFRLYAPDPQSAGKVVDVVACKDFEVTLAEPIAADKPVVIEKIVLDRPSIAAIAMGPGSTEFLGVPKLPKSVTATTASTSTTEKEPAGEPAGPAKKLSDLVRVKSFRLEDASVVYDARLPGTSRMWIDGIDTAVTMDAVNPGLYHVSTKLGRESLFDFSVVGDVDVDALTLAGFKLNLNADLTQGKLDFLPPQLQAVLKQNDAKGKLAVAVTAAVPFRDLPKATAQADVSLQNINLASGGARVPVDSLVLKASLADGKFLLQNLRIDALQSAFDVTGSTVLNDRLDTELTVTLKDIVLEKLAAALPTKKPLPRTTTTLNATVQVKAAVGVALGMTKPAAPDEPIASMAIRDVRLSVDDPTEPGQPLDFVSLNTLGVALTQMPAAGKPFVVDRVVIDAPALRAVAMEPESNELAGINNLMLIADSFAEAENATTTQPAATQPSQQPAMKVSQLVQVKAVDLTDASLYYDPRLEGTVPFTMTRVGAEVGLDSPAGDTYKFHAIAPAAKPQFAFEAGGRLNVDTLAAQGLKAHLAVDLGQREAAYLPPQLQLAQKVYELEGMLAVDVTGDGPLTDPMTTAVRVDVRLDDVKATVADYRLPVDHVRLPLQLKDGKAHLLDPTQTMGGHNVDLLGGTVDLTGAVDLDDVLTANLVLQVDGLKLEQFAATQMTEEKMELIGDTYVKMILTDAPLLTIAEHASVAAPADGSTAAPQAISFKPLPDKWGTVDVEVMNARLAGFELIQQMGNAAKLVFVDLFKKEDERGANAIKPKEHAEINIDLVNDRADFTHIFYEGEVVAVDGKGYITLDQRLDMKLAGGPIAKLGGLGGFGRWMKDASNSVIYYEITGTVMDYKFHPKFGDGKPIGKGIDFVAKKTGGGIKKGAEETGKLFNKVFGKKKKPAGE